MYLGDLLQHIKPLQFNGDPGMEIQGLYYDSRQVQPGGLFFALRGAAADGHRYIGSALQAGAAAVVAEDASSVPIGATSVIVPDARQAMSRAAAIFYGDPTASVPLVGITGTNGKTTTSYLVEAILEAAGKPAAVLGTVNYRFRDTALPAPNTTPESVDLQRTLRELVDAGAEAIVMEVSSHALEQKRVDGCHFDVGVFTNLTRDHLDYHLTMDAYLASKTRLFSELLAEDRLKQRRRAAVNCDDPYGSAIAGAAACPVLTYGLGTGFGVTATNVRFSVEGIEGVLVTPAGRALFHSPMLGRFNLYNILAAAATGVALDLPLEAIRLGIEGHRRVPGRLERAARQLVGPPEVSLIRRIGGDPVRKHVRVHPPQVFPLVDDDRLVAGREVPERRGAWQDVGARSDARGRGGRRHRHAVAGQAADFVLFARPTGHLGVRPLHHLEIVFVRHGCSSDG